MGGNAKTALNVQNVALKPSSEKMPLQNLYTIIATQIILRIATNVEQKSMKNHFVAFVNNLRDSQIIHLHIVEFASIGLIFVVLESQ